MNDFYMEHNNGRHVKLDGSSSSKFKARFQVFKNGNGTYSFKARRSNWSQRYIQVANNSKLYVNTSNRFKSAAQFDIKKNDYIYSRSKGKYLTDSSSNITASVAKSSVNVNRHGGFAFHKADKQNFR